MKNKAIIYITFLSVLAFNSYGQSTGEKKGDKQYAKYAYIDATKTYGFGPTSEFGNQTVTVLGESATNTTPTTTTSTTQPGAAAARPPL